MFPAARLSDPITHDLLAPSGIIGPPLTPCPQAFVLIEGLPAAHVSCTCVCSGAISAGLAHPPPPAPPPPPVISGSATVMIHGQPAARWVPSGDLGGCGSMLGDPLLAASRQVFIGGTTVFVASRVYTTAPTLSDLTNDPFVNQELRRAFKESNPNAPDVPQGQPGSIKCEQGGWIVWNRNSGQLEVIRVPPGTRDGLATISGTRPPDNADQQVVGWFHTHPNRSSEGYSSNPSPEDRLYQNNEARAPGLVETHDGRREIPYP